MRARVQPCKTAVQGLHLQFSVVEETLVDRGDFQFAALGGLDGLGHIHHLVRVEVEAHYGIIRLGSFGFLFDADGVAAPVKFHHAVAFGVVDAIAKDSGLALLFGRDHGIAEHGAPSAAVEDVVAQNEAGAIVADKLLADDECLCQSVGRRLFGIGELHAVVRSIAQQTLESGQVLRRGDDENLADASKHQHRDGVVHHRFVEYGDELFAYTLCDGVEACAATACQNDSFHNGMCVSEED